VFQDKTAWGLVFLLSTCTGMVVGCEPGDHFRCGRRSPTSAEPRECRGFGEICICSTGGCAVPHDRNVCESGYRYVDRPFGPVDAGVSRCVDVTDLPSREWLGESDRFCRFPSQGEAAEDAGEDDSPPDATAETEDAGAPGGDAG
jgi:hypothetical protein